MNCLIINPNWRDAKELGRMCSAKTPTFPIELFYISDDLMRNGIENKLLDLWAENKHLEDYKEDLKNTDFIVLDTAPSYCYWRDGTIDVELPKKMIEKIKAMSNAKIIVIGPHGTIYPEIFKDVIVIRGEPEFAISKLIKTGKNENVHIIENLDDLPTLTFSQNVDFSNYFVTEFPEKNKNFALFYEASRGCPFQCIFCFREGFRSKFRKKSLKRVEEEVKKMKEIGVRYIYLIDECFGIDKNWASDIAKIFKDLNINWGFQTRPDILTFTWIDELSQSNCKYIYIGLEAVNREIAKKLGKGVENLKEFKKILDYMVKRNITPFLSMIIGSPRETRETIKEMEIFLTNLDVKIFSDVYILLPYPNTKIWKMDIKEGKSLKSWKDVKRYAGIIGNNLSQNFVKSEERRLNIMIYRKRTTSLTGKLLTKIGLLIPNTFQRVYSKLENKRW